MFSSIATKIDCKMLVDLLQNKQQLYDLLDLMIKTVGI